MHRTESRTTVLVVDDNSDNRIILSTILEAAGYGVRQASDGAEAVRLVRLGGADVVLMDLCMPGMDGWQATREIRGDPSTAHVPVIAITALTTHHGRPLCESGDWDGVLRKPVPLQEVLDAVARCAAIRVHRSIDEEASVTPRPPHPPLPPP